jgi:hypothetical protein
MKNLLAPLPLYGVMKHNVGSPGTITLYDVIILSILKNARNTNPGSFEAYSQCAGILPTGLIGADDLR